MFILTKLLKKYVKISHNNIVRFMKIIILTGFLHILIIIPQSIFMSSISEFSEFDLKIYIIFSIAFSVLISLTTYTSKFTYVIELKNITGIPSYTRLLEYYSTLIPLFLLSSAILLISISLLSKILFILNYIAIACMFFAMIVGLSLFFIKSIYHEKIFYTLNRANNIYSYYIIKEKKKIYIKEFMKFFERTIINTDRNLTKGIKINELKREETVSIKNTIIHYLPIYIKYGSELQINLLKSNIEEMSKLVNKNDGINSLKITNDSILNIYKDILEFLESNHYSVNTYRQYKNITSWAFYIFIGILSIYVVTYDKIYIIKPLFDYLPSINSIITILAPIITAIAMIVAAYIMRPKS